MRQQPLQGQGDATWKIRGPDGRQATLVVEVKKHVSPASVQHGVIPQLGRHIRQVGGSATAILVSSWLSPRTRQVLEAKDISYLDVTGNISLRVADPAIVIRTRGEQRDPAPRRQVRRGISGPRAGRIVRQLVDFQPPRRPSELAAAADISESYTSRLLEVLSEEALIRRKGHVITKVDWQNLLRARANSYQLIRTNHVVGTVARRGLDATYNALRNGATSHPVLMTGAMVANNYAPLVVGGALMLYVPPGPHIVDEVIKDLGLLRAPSGATVQLLQPMSEGAMERPGPKIDGIGTVGLSQLVLDCLSGPGRLPAAGEALIEWMENHEDDWRRGSPIAGGKALL
ncbi:hypothetical protein BJF78_10120 [Pseudonocardia sp. CNS-139]|nr:hypothetical protein BJF78_10120 [Pseudonocardia sp. CNS-139]